jgi:hypothetical protein
MAHYGRRVLQHVLNFLLQVAGLLRSVGGSTVRVGRIHFVHRTGVTPHRRFQVLPPFGVLEEIERALYLLRQALLYRLLERLVRRA